MAQSSLLSSAKTGQINRPCGLGVEPCLYCFVANKTREQDEGNKKVNNSAQITKEGLRAE
jgi:hypothetical protein